MSQQKKFILWGSSGHAKVLNSLLKSRGCCVVALFDNDPEAKAAIPDIPLYIGEAGFSKWHQQKAGDDIIYGLAAIGGDRGSDRLFIHDYLKKYQIVVEVVVHPDASVCDTAQFGEGTQVFAQSVVSSDVRVGKGCIINHSVIVDHECELGDGVHLAPNVTLCGCVKVGFNVMVGAGAVVLPRVNIEAHSIIGAGAVVTKDVPSGVIVAGNPAKVIRQI